MKAFFKKWCFHDLEKKGGIKYEYVINPKAAEVLQEYKQDASFVSDKAKQEQALEQVSFRGISTFSMDRIHQAILGNVRPPALRLLLQAYYPYGEDQRDGKCTILHAALASLPNRSNSSEQSYLQKHGALLSLQLDISALREDSL